VEEEAGGGGGGGQSEENGLGLGISVLYCSENHHYRELTSGSHESENSVVREVCPVQDNDDDSEKEDKFF
jgi:hypothetical protein